MSLDDTISKLHSKTAHIGVFGLGYVGLPLALSFSEAGYRVSGFDTDPAKGEAIATNRSYLNHISAERIAAAVKNGFQVHNNYEASATLDALIICVPTPLNKTREPDLSFVTATINGICPFLKKHQIVSLESTTYPGTTSEVLRPRIEQRGFNIGEDLYLIYSPEREDPGNSRYNTRTIPKICGGETENCLQAGIALYSSVIEQVVPVSNTKTAEMAKLLENIYRAVNIGLVNEMKVVADKMGINIHEVIDAAATKPFGFTKFTPGPGLGGHCIPIDPFYLTWKAREYGIHTRFIELAGEINRAMPDYVIQKTADALNEHGKPIKSSKILVLGLAYKKNVSDTRESPAVEIIAQLKAKGAIVEYSDPHVPTFPKKRDYAFDMQSIEITPENLRKYDCAILITEHDSFDYPLITQNSKLVIDTRNRLPREAHIISA
ncbi:nucleotide sugar dehydrogenase [Spongiibacter taiwanensis]|uniref:nucleotide sugar dehydrogenase n=1 Tax=Spongiibacter taiwanensis TaxID=1748242 RepID=UPI002035D877|nr:nucleotide sugar dehydrogenase [Spongiibacter taiwanensis]USA44253.1 nucleotide sugar dehydrogenase [Spongiibacter taiwanensis]